MTSSIRFFRVGALVALLALFAAACATEGGDITGDASAAEESSEPSTEESSEGSSESSPEEDSSASEGGGEAASGGSVTVGSANFTESIILGHLYSEVLEEAGFTVQRELNLGARELTFPALEQGELDVFPEYIGATYFFIQQEADPITETDELVTALTEVLPEGLTLLEPSEAQDRDAMVVTSETAQEYGLATVSDLAEVDDQLVYGGSAEQIERPIGIPGLRDVYGVEFAEFVTTDAVGPITIEALQSGRIDVARLNSTAPQITENDWVVLEWDQPLVPAENIAPIVREEVLTPEMEEALNELSATLTTEDLTELNRLVDLEQADPDAVALDYLLVEGLIEP